MPPFGSKRNDAGTSAESSPTEANKKPRLDIQDQIKRASTLAAQLRDGVKDGADTKTAAANQIATEELLRIFESMQEKTVEYASQSFEALVQAQIRTEVESTTEFLKRNAFNSYPLGVEIKEYLVSNPRVTNKSLTETVQKKMDNVTPGDYIAKIKELVKEAVREKFLEGVGEKFDGILVRLRK
ncbi:hypothetical protein E4T48_03613 [Aureobasidium sp. EXF-10727]|nr:hypothetical protein E4T48_03613 [Aureobasidium sp. EXF-10727]